MARVALNKTVLFLGVSILLAVMAALLVRQHLRSQEAALAERFAQRGEMISVAVPRKTIEAGALISMDDFASRQVPVEFIPEDAVSPDDFEKAEGQTTRVRLEAGRPLMWSFLSSGRSPAFSDMLSSGRRAVTIQVDEINSVSGMLRPGDRIDLLRVTTAQGSGNMKTVAPLLQNVPVRATGTVTRREVDVSTGESVERQYSTVTLDLEPRDVGKVVLAQDMNALRAVLRGVNEKTKEVDFGVVSENDIRSGMSAEDGESGVSGRVIEFYLGGQGGPLQPVAIAVDRTSTEKPEFAVADERAMRGAVEAIGRAQNNNLRALAPPAPPAPAAAPAPARESITISRPVRPANR